MNSGELVTASYLEAEIIVSCDLLGNCQLDEIITQSCSCTIPWSHGFSCHATSCFDSCGRGLVPVSILCTNQKAKGKQRGWKASFIEDCQGFPLLEIAMLRVKKFYCYHVNIGSLWSVKSFTLLAFPRLDLCPWAKPIFQCFTMLQLSLSLSIKANTWRGSLCR